MDITGVRLSTPIYDNGSEKRRHTRVSFGHRARIYPLMEMATGNGSPVLVRDLSRSGLGFQINDELTVGDEFVLQLFKQTGETVHLQCIVARCEPGGTGLVQFVVGATFELVLTEAQWKPPQAAPQARPVLLSGKQATAVASMAMASADSDDADSSRIRSRLAGLGRSSNSAATPAMPAPVLLVEPAPVVSSERLAVAHNKLFAASSSESASAISTVAKEMAAPIVRKAVIKPLPPLEPLREVEATKPVAEVTPVESAPVAVAQPLKVEPAPVVEVAAPHIEIPKAVEVESKPAEAIEPVTAPAVETSTNEEAEVLFEEVLEFVEAEILAAAVEPSVMESAVVEPVQAASIKPVIVPVVLPVAPVVAPVATVMPMQAGSSPMLVLVVPTGSMPAGQQAITVTAGGISITVSFASAPAVAPIAAEPAGEFTPGVTPESMFDLLAESLGDESSEPLAA